MKLTEQQITAHEGAYHAAVARHEMAARDYRAAEKALAVARASLTRAERERADEWSKLSIPFAGRAALSAEERT